MKASFSFSAGFVGFVCCVLLVGSAAAQTTWIFTQCQNNNPRLFNYSTDSMIPGDPVGPGFNISNTSTAVPAVTSNQSRLQGAIAVDKVNKTLWVTDGVIVGQALTIHIIPINTANCSIAAGTIVSVSGSVPSGFGTYVTGMDIQYATSPGGQDLPWRLWLTSDLNYTWLRINFPGPTFSWHVNTWPVPNTGVGVGDLAFGYMQIYTGGAWQSPVRALFAMDSLASSSMITVFTPTPGGGVFLFTLGTGLFNQSGITLDTSLPYEGLIGFPTTTVRLRGAPLVLGQNPPSLRQIKDLTATRPVWSPNGLGNVCFGGGAPYIPAIAYSAEITSLGSPCGNDICTLGTPSTARADIFPDPTLLSPGQPLVQVTADTPSPPTCQGPSSTLFRVEACNLTGPGAVTAFLVYMKNQVSTVLLPTHTGVKCNVLVDPSSPNATIIAGTPGALPPQWYVDFNATNIPSIPASPVCWNTQHYYYAQWFFFCGGAFNLNQPFFVSDPFRIAVSNPH